MKLKLFLFFFFFSFGVVAWSFWHSDKVDYNTQIKPIFNKNCIVCHGGVKQAGKMSLLFRSEAIQKGKSGKLCIVPGDASASELIRRIKSTDPDLRMPKKGEPLKAEEIELLETNTYLESIIIFICSF